MMHGINTQQAAMRFDPHRLTAGQAQFESAALKSAKAENARIRKESDAKTPISGYTPPNRTHKQVEAKKEDQEKTSEMDAMKRKLYGFDPTKAGGAGEDHRVATRRQIEETITATRSQEKTAYAADTQSREQQAGITHARAEAAYKEHMEHDQDAKAD